MALLFGMFLAVFLGLIPASIAKSKGRSFAVWWFYGWALFIVALPHALLIRTDARTADRLRMEDIDGRKCPHCAEVIRREAKVCRFCGRDVEPAVLAKPAGAEGFLG